MVESFKKMFLMSILSSIFFIVIGLFLIMKPDTTMAIISYAIGSLILVSGTIFLIKYFTNRDGYTMFSGELILGVICVIVGISLFLNPKALASIIHFILGMWIIISSVTKIQYAFQLKAYNNKAWVPTMILAAITFIWGLLLLFDPFEGAMLITQIIGIFILIYAILDLIEIFIIRKNLKDIKEGIIEIIK